MRIEQCLPLPRLLSKGTGVGRGLQRVAKMCGGIVINGERFVWDYVADECVPEADMPFGSKRHRASERKRAELMREQLNEQGKS